MKRSITISTVMVLLVLAVGSMPRGFAAESADNAQQTKAKIDAARVEITEIRHQVELTLESLNRLKLEAVELRPQFKLYSTELAKMEKGATVARERAVSMNEKGKAYFKSWEDTIKTIANKDIRKQAEKRYEKRLKSYNKIITAMTEGRDRLLPFMSDLNDLKTLLGSELSRESVKSAAGLIKQANWHGEDVTESLKDVETELDRVSAELAKYK